MSLANTEPTSVPLVENEEFSIGDSTPPLSSIDDIMSRENIDEVMMSEVMNLENIKYQGGEAVEDIPESIRAKRENLSPTNIDETFSLFRVYVVYFFGLIVDTYFVYNFWNINIRTGFNVFSLAAVIAFLLPLAIIICLPSSCVYLMKQGFLLRILTYSICWLSFALSLIPNIEARVSFEMIYFAVFCFHFMLMLSPSQNQNLLRHRRFLDSNVISFFYVACLRWIYIGYIPSFISGWFAALNIFFGFICLIYLVFEEIVFRMCCPKRWELTNTHSKTGTLDVAKELYESVTPSKSFTERITSILLWKFRSQRSIITRLPTTNEERLLCVRLYSFEVLIGIISVFSLILFSAGFSVVLTLVTHFALPPLSLPVWAGRESYFDGLFVIFSLVFGIVISVLARPNNNIEDFHLKQEKGDENEDDDVESTIGTTKRRRYNGWTLQNVFCSPIIFLGFLFFLLSIFGLLSYAFNLNFVFWSGNLIVIFLPSMFEFFLGESIHFQYLQLHDVLDCPFYVYHLLRRLVVNVLTNYEGGMSHDSKDLNSFRSSYSFRGPGLFLGCGYLFFVITLLSSISVWVYQMFPGFGDVFGGKTYLVYVILVVFFFISSVSVCLNRCVLLLRYRLFVGSRFLSCCSVRMLMLLVKSVFVPRVVEYELYDEILVFERKSRRELIRAAKAHERKQKTSMSEKEIEMIYQEFQKSDEDDSDELLEEGGGEFFGDEQHGIDDEEEEEDTSDVDDDAEEEGEEENQQQVEVEQVHPPPQDDDFEDNSTERPIEEEEEAVVGEEEEDSKLQRIDEEEDDDDEKKKSGDVTSNDIKPKNETTPIITKEDELMMLGQGNTRETIVPQQFLQACQLCSNFLFRSITRFVTCSSFCILLPGFCFLFIGMISVPQGLPLDQSYHEGFFRLATFNVFHGFMLNGLDNGPQIADDFLKGQEIDFCGFQETCTARPETGYQDIIKYYGIESGARNYVQGKESRESTIGVSIVTRLPVGEVRDEMFTHEEGGLDRMFQYSTVEMNGTVVNIINTHFDLVDDIKLSQANQLIDFLETIDLLPIEYDLPIIMMGDFNSKPNLTSIEVFKSNGFKDAYFEVTGRHDITSQKGDSQGGCIDYIFYRGSQLIPIEAYVYRAEDYGLPRPSDHYPVVVDFKVLQSS